MAQSSSSKKTATGTKKAAASSRSRGSSTRSASTSRASKSSGDSAAPAPPRRREIAAAICFALGVFSFIGYFDSEPLFISFFTGFAKRLIGHGFFALPPALIMCSVILAFHKGYPVLMRTISTLSLTAVIGAFIHTIGYPLFSPSDPDKYELSFQMFAKLWTQGAELQAGGVLSGGVSQLFLVLFGRAGTIVTLVIMIVILGLIAFNATVAGVLGAFSKREKRQYEIEEFDAQDVQSGSEEERAIEEAYREQARRKYRFPLVPQWKKKNIDIPLDDKKSLKKDYFADEPLGELYNKTPNVRTPDEVVSGISPEETAGGEMFRENKTPMEDLPLDIPFINENWEPVRHPPPVVPPILEEDFINKEPPKFTPDTILPPDVMRQVKEKKKKDVFDMPVPEGADATEENYKLPPLELLSKGNFSNTGSRSGNSEVNLNIERLEAAFQSFGINVNIANHTRGPSVTRYEAELEAGVKLSRLTGLSDDIALALGTLGVRIAAMPNKIATVGIEVPNKSVSSVHLRDVLESSAFTGSPSKLTFAIGMDISGQPIVGEISKLPHMLVAGTTGSGKSVCLNSIILSILYKATPKDVRFIMLDPKMVEFKVYNDIPHLLVPVVTDVKKAAGALQWATFEMMKRYSLFSDTNARDIAGYNKIAEKSNEEREPMAHIVIIIDELADMMMVAGKEVEEAVCRVAQMGRAAGIHLIIATQSPRANVITGLMKANIPSRIALKVASALESQIILDPGQAADKLVGNGDMLYSPTGAAKPMRLQGTWVSDKEREKVVEFFRKSSEAQYSEEVIHEIEKASADKSSGGSGGDYEGDSETDELLPQAVDVILESGQASVSMLQRRLRLGYARAARIVDQMEEMGVVGPSEGSKPREVLINKNQWYQMQYGTGVAPPDKPADDDDEV